MAKIARGAGKIEFFSNFDYIRKKYYEGHVVVKELFLLTAKEKKLTLSYNQFSIYFKKYILLKDERIFHSGANEITAKKEESITQKETPKVKIITSGDHIDFNPHTVKINKEDIL